MNETWTAAPNMLLDVKPYGAAKHVPAVLVAVATGRQADQLMVQIVGEIPEGVRVKEQPDQPPRTVVVYFDQTRQCHRFTRTVTKAVKLIAMLAREAGKKRSSAARLAAVAAARAGRDGECQICAHRQIVQKGNLVLHGYERPGTGMTHGQCYGYGYAAYEVSCERLKWFVADVLQTELVSTQAQLDALPGRATLPREEALLGAQGLRQYDDRGHTLYHVVQVARGDLGFDRLEKSERAQLTARIDGLAREIGHQQGRIATWRAPSV